MSRSGASADGERTKAIREFAPLKDPSHVRQFLGSTNWVRWYLPTVYPAAQKMLTEYVRPSAGKSFPAKGLGAPPLTETGDKAVQAIKIMAAHCIEMQIPLYNVGWGLLCT